MGFRNTEHILLALVHPLQSGGSGPAERWPGRSAGPGAGSAASHWRLTPSSGTPLGKKQQIPALGDVHAPKLPLKAPGNQIQALQTEIHPLIFLGMVNPKEFQRLGQFLFKNKKALFGI